MFYCKGRMRRNVMAALMGSLSVVGSQAATVQLAWDANTEADLAGYRLYYGVSSDSYTNQIDVGNATSGVVSNLQFGVLYYFACTAYNTSGLESEPSNEVSVEVVNPSSTTNLPPTLDPISNQILAANSGPIMVNLTGISPGSNEVQTLTLTAESSNPGLISTPSISYTNYATTGVLTLAPAPNTTGVAVITVTLNDGRLVNNTFSRSFEVTVQGPPPPISIARSGANVVVSWPATGNYVLQFSTEIAPIPTWANVGVTPALSGTNYEVMLAPTGAHTFYRLAPAGSSAVESAQRLLVESASATLPGR